MSKFTFIHLSDLHFSHIPDRVNALSDGGHKDLIRRVNWILEQKRTSSTPWSYPTTYQRDVAAVLHRHLAKKIRENALDGIVVTGDLATTGWQRDIEIARQFFSGKLPSAMDVLGTGVSANTQNLFHSIPLIALPGNHDRYNGKWGLPRSKNYEGRQGFGKGWSNHWNHIVTCSPNSTRLCYASIPKGGSHLAFVQIDLSLERAGDANSLFGIFGQGLAYSNVLKELKKVTSQIREKYKNNVAVVWLCHFPPEYDGDPNLELVRGKRLLKAANECDVPYILAGHVHAPSIYHVTGLPSVHVLCAGSATDPAGMPTYNEICFNVDRSKVTCSIEFHSYKGGEFVRGM